jgi:hypothetical protein
MPVVSPALTRQLSMKIREEMVMEDRVDNWRSIINLQPITQLHTLKHHLVSKEGREDSSSSSSSSFRSDFSVEAKGPLEEIKEEESIGS